MLWCTLKILEKRHGQRLKRSGWFGCDADRPCLVDFSSQKRFDRFLECLTVVAASGSLDEILLLPGSCFLTGSPGVVSLTCVDAFWISCLLCLKLH